MKTQNNFSQLIQTLFKALLSVLKNLHPQMPVAPSSQDTPATKPPPEPTPQPQRVGPVPKNPGFLICPIQGTTPYTVRISGVIDHSDTAIDPNSSKYWGLHAKDQKVKAFNDEIGDGEASAEVPYGYTKKAPAPFFSKGEINYVGAHCAKDKYGPTYYLNYDGHAGYDFSYTEMTPVVAAASGKLFKLENSEDTSYGQGWPIHHTFVINHGNDYSTSYRHCVKLEDSIEAQIGNDFSKPVTVVQGQVVAYVGSFGAHGAVHLHFEVHHGKSGAVVDPYEDNLWQDKNHDHF